MDELNPLLVSTHEHSNIVSIFNFYFVFRWMTYSLTFSIMRNALFTELCGVNRVFSYFSSFKHRSLINMKVNSNLIFGFHNRTDPIRLESRKVQMNTSDFQPSDRDHDLVFGNLLEDKTR